MIGCCEFIFLIKIIIKVKPSTWTFLVGLIELLLSWTIKNIKTLLTLPYLDNLVHNTSLRQKTWFTWPCLCKSFHLLHIYWKYGQTDTETKTLFRTFKWLKLLILIHVLTLDRAYERFLLKNLTIALLHCPLLFL